MDLDAVRGVPAGPGRGVPAPARAPHPAPRPRPLAAVPLAGLHRRRPRRADGAHRRGAGRRVGAVAAPAVRGGDPRRRDLGSRHPRRQGLAGRHLRGRRGSARRRASPPPAISGSPSARARRPPDLTRRRGRGAPVTRGDAVVRARRGRRHRARRVPRHEPPLGVVGVAEKGTTTIELRAEGRGGHSSTPAPGGPTARIARAVVRLEKRQFAPLTPRADAGDVPPAGAARPAGAAAALRERPSAAAAAEARAARGGRRTRRPGAYDDGRHHPLRLAGPQRDRLERHRGGQPAHPGRRHRRERHRARTQGHRRRLDPPRGGRRQRAQPGQPDRRPGLRADHLHDRRGVRRTPCRRRT